MDRLIRRDDLDFLLFDLLEIEQLFAWPRFEGHDRPGVAAVLDTADQLARRHFLSHDRQSDRCEPCLEDGRVRLIEPLGRALDAFAEAGFLAAHHDTERGVVAK